MDQTVVMFHWIQSFASKTIVATKEHKNHMKHKIRFLLCLCLFVAITVESAPHLPPLPNGW